MLHKMNIGIRKKRRDVIIYTRNKYENKNDNNNANFNNISHSLAMLDTERMLTLTG